MTTTKLGRFAGAALLVLTLSAALSAPAFSMDTGGGGGATGGGSSGSGGGSTSHNNGGGGNSGGGSAAAATPTLADARADIAAKNWAAAVTKLKLFVAANSKSADGYNLLGYSYRNLGKYDLAGKAYARALKLDPKHTGALEYQGVLFIKLGQIDKAKANLAKIETICGNTTCEEYQDLAKAIG